MAAGRLETVVNVPGTAPDITRIRSAVAAFVDGAGFDWAALKGSRAAVPLAEICESHSLCLVEMSRLTHASVGRHMAGLGVSSLPAEPSRCQIAGYIFGDVNRAFIFINRDDPFARRRFSLAHEIGHYMLHRGGFLARATARPKPVPVELEYADPREAEADAFAAEILMPWELVAPDAMPLHRGEIGPERAVTRLAARLQVSRQAASRRLREWPGAS